VEEPRSPVGPAASSHDNSKELRYPPAPNAPARALLAFCREWPPTSLKTFDPVDEVIE
jgi:hypothetical protein